MANPWIKVEKETPKKIEITRISRVLNISRERAFYLCFNFWCWCDTHLTNGRISGLCVDDIDEIVEHSGFASALIEVKWLGLEDGNTIVVPNFCKHLGQSAKTRARTASRTTEYRKRRDRKS